MTHCLRPARKFVQSHLKNRGEHSILVTEASVKYWWRVLNVAVFDGKLYTPSKIRLCKEITVEGKVSVWAVCRDRSKQARSIGQNGISLKVQHHYPSRKLFLNVLVHEMVHAWEIQYNGDATHGPKFFAWRDKIRKATGLHLERRIGE